ncbi:hypothetical protein [Flavobacterium sp. JAS]|uniref:hypothetical protein n=1 Tax=Flavobacterium sp. JAS TaxID=2897329 RepID=UPI001E4B4F62|nr:hypothetical protein [Flavobacterium sp. JAS]MCD0469599.1 hypothetical protein [Flavobacterium sp. JAS]
MKSKVFLLLMAISIISCNKKEDVKAVVSKKDTLNQEVVDEEYEDNAPDEVVLKGLDFPKTGGNVEAFVPEPCEIKMKAEGFLNDDDLKDIVIVLQNKENNTDSRATLVLLQQETGGYKLQELSWEAMEPEYTSDGYKLYDYEEISIDKEKKLRIELQGVGAIGNRETVYKYINDKLVLVRIETFHSGAGSYTSSDYDLVSGEVDHEITNTMVDSMPSVHEIEKFKLKGQMLFTNDNPDRVLENMYK